MDAATQVAHLPWTDVWGQADAVSALREAASDPAAMTHAWLITGPPGSGRSTLAYAFAETEGLLGRDQPLIEH